VDEGIVKGPLPKQLPDRMKLRDQRPLPDGALLRFQQMSRGRSPAYNRRWVLFSDGRVYYDRHRGNERDWSSPFKEDLRPKADTNISPESVKAVESWLREADFFDEPPYQVDHGVRDGDNFFVTARLDDRLHEVIYAAVYPPLVENLLNLIAQSNASGT
jgi:hypothetical protein